MDGFEKSAKTMHTPPRVPFQTKTRARAAAEVSVAETAAANTTDTDWRLVAGGARLVTDVRLITDHSSTLTSHRRSVYSSLLFFMKRSCNFKIKPAEYNLIHSNTQTTPTINVLYTSNKNPQPIRLGYSSFENTRSLVENSITLVNLS